MLKADERGLERAGASVLSHPDTPGTRALGGDTRPAGVHFGG